MVQTGGTMDSRSYRSIDSSHVIQGESNKLVDTRINIESSFNRRKNQIDQLAELIDLLKNESESKKEEREQVILNLEKIRDELGDEEQPDEGEDKEMVS